MLVAAFACATVTLFVAGALAGPSSSNGTDEDIFEAHVAPVLQLNEILHDLRNTRSLVLTALLSKPPQNISAVISEYERSTESINRRWDLYAARQLTPQQLGAARTFNDARAAYLLRGIGREVSALQCGSLEEARRLAVDAGPVFWKPVEKSMMDLIDIQLRMDHTYFKVQQAGRDEFVSRTWFSTALSGAAACFLGVAISLVGFPRFR